MAKKSFCKVCFDAGLPESKYTNHFVRATPDPASDVVCPTILAIECRYCLTLGHMVSKCPKLLRRKDATVDKKNTADADEVILKKTPSYADILMKPLRPASPVRPPSPDYPPPSDITPYVPTTTTATSIFKKKYYSSWADAESSDDE
jgi:hypothetical protein